MNYLAKVFQPYYKELAKKIENEDFVIDKTGCKIAEIIAPRIEFDMNEVDVGYIDFECRKSPRSYCEKENEWYISKELNIKKVNNVTTWTRVCDENDEVNSNYGWLAYSKGNFSQFSHCLKKLQDDRDSRQAIIIYTRPSMHLEYNDLGGMDFICTNFQHFFIRNNKLYCVTSMRSNDCYFGTFSDIPWFTYVYNDMFTKLLATYPELQKGTLTFIPNSFHAYERHFDKIKEIANEI